MAANYTCDFCDAPLKDSERELVTRYKQNKFNPQNVDDYLKETNEICASCSKLLDLFFKLKKDKLKEWEKLFEKMYKLPTKEPKKRKNKEEKK